MSVTTPAVRNWAGNITFSASAVHRPTSIEQLQQVVAAGRRVRALGSGHSFSPVADTDGELVALDRLPRLLEVDRDAARVTLSGGLRYGDIVRPMHEAGLALPTMGSLPHISVAGAASTGTHGSGDANQVLAASVVAVQLVTAEGDLLELDRSDPRFPGAVLALGSLGVVTRLTLEAVPAFDLVQQVHEDIPLPVLLENVDEVLASGWSVSAFTGWAPGSTASVWCKRRPGGGPVPADWLGGVVADGPRHPVPGMPAVHCTEQSAVAGPWFERLPHFRLEFTPSSGDELQSEYLLPREHGVAALRAVAPLGSRIAPLLRVGELRSIAADDLWLSAAQGRDSLALHFTWFPDLEALRPVLAELETALAPFGARPHWGKVFTTPAGTVAGLYPHLTDFVALRDELDPGRCFGNEFVDRYVGG